jgi:hypothetical protein
MGKEAGKADPRLCREFLRIALKVSAGKGNYECIICPGGRRRMDFHRLRRGAFFFRKGNLVFYKLHSYMERIDPRGKGKGREG